MGEGKEKVLVLRRSSDEGLAGLSLGVYIRREGPNGASASIMCPACFLPLKMDPTDVSENGEVPDGISCPCGWGSLIRLDGWKR